MENLNVETFRVKVFDFEKNKDWSFAGDKPCIVDFYADWCGPCRMLAPVLEELSGEYAGKVNIYKVNTEQEGRLAGMFGIRSIPTLMFIPKNGRPQVFAGALPKQELEKSIHSVLGVEK